MAYINNINKINNKIRLVDRDYIVMREIERWRVCQARHLKSLAAFSSQRTCDRRLKKLLEYGYLDRKKILYGVPYLYFLEPKSKLLINASARPEKVRIEQIKHDIDVLDTALYFHYKYQIPFSDMTTEKQLHSQDGFSNRKHRPDFVFKWKSSDICVEVELSLKARSRFENNIRDNFSNYDYQQWIVSDDTQKIRRILEASKDLYPNIKIIPLEEVKAYVKQLY